MLVLTLLFLLLLGMLVCVVCSIVHRSLPRAGCASSTVVAHANAHQGRAPFTTEGLQRHTARGRQRRETSRRARRFSAAKWQPKAKFLNARSCDARCDVRFAATQAPARRAGMIGLTARGAQRAQSK